MIVLWDGQMTRWNSSQRHPLWQQWVAVLRGETEGVVGFFFLDTRMEADCLDMELHMGTTVMNTTGEQIHGQLIKHLHGVRYQLVFNKQDLVHWRWTKLQGLFGRG